MGYEESTCTCSWCGKLIEDSTDAACKKCYEKLEAELAEAKSKIDRLNKVILSLEHDIEKNKK
jgi:hypothetical protein